MLSFSLFSALLLSNVNQVSALACSGVALPTWITSGTSYNIVTQSSTSPTGAYNTTISGSFVVDGQCTWSINNLNLANAPVGESIKVYGINAAGAFPLSQYVLTGNYTNTTLLTPTVLDASLYQQGVAGVSWPQVYQIIFFGETDNWVIAKVFFSGAPTITTATVTYVPYTTATATSTRSATATSTQRSSVHGLTASIVFMLTCVVVALL